MKITCISLVIFILSVFFGLSAFGQVSKGNFMVGGSGAFSHEKQEFDTGSGVYQESQTNNYISFGPSVGYFFTRGLVGGLSVNFSRENQESEMLSNVGRLTQEFSVNPFVKYYLKNGIFGMASVGYGRSRIERRFGDNLSTGETKREFFTWQAGVGYAIFLNKNVSLEPMVNYSVKIDDSDELSDVKERDSRFTVGLGFNIFLGK